MNKVFLILLSVSILISTAGIVSASDVSVWQGQYYTGTKFNTGTYEFNFSVYDALTGGDICYSNTINLTTGSFGEWKTEQSGVSSACSNVSKDYYLDININGVDQTPRRRLVIWDSLRKNVDELSTGSIETDIIKVRIGLKDLNKAVWQSKLDYAQESANTTLVSQQDLALKIIAIAHKVSDTTSGESLELKTTRLQQAGEQAKAIIKSDTDIAIAKILEAKRLALLKGVTSEDMAAIEEEARLNVIALNLTAQEQISIIENAVNNSIAEIISSDDSKRFAIKDPDGSLNLSSGNITTTGTGFFGLLQTDSQIIAPVVNATQIIANEITVSSGANILGVLRGHSPLKIGDSIQYVDKNDIPLFSVYTAGANITGNNVSSQYYGAIIHQIETHTNPSGIEECWWDKEDQEMRMCMDKSTIEMWNDLIVNKNMRSTGNATAAYFIGNGSLLTGINGTPGPQGIQGIQGIPGINGTNGVDGINGTDGADGYTPVYGIDYANGSQGPQGIQGEKGEKGDTGPKGEQGDQGIQGIPGDKGDTGDTGPKGEQGDKGDTGEQGIQGLKGEKGEQGDTGDTGPKGEQGDKGDTGEQGIQGLKGEQGDIGIQGIPGDKGDTGTNGIDGVDGINGTDGADGYTPIYGIDYANGSQGPQGIQGIRGEKGDQGIQGIPGDKGEKGEQGDPGPAGSKGDTGNTGLQGEQGDTGPAGANGTQGPQGEKGEQGDTGNTGLQGPKGDPGINGTNGIDGYTPVYGIDYANGSQGPQGEQGDTGPAGANGTNGTSFEVSGDYLQNYLYNNGSNVIFFDETKLNSTIDARAVTPDLTNYALKNQSETFSGNITATGTGFFAFLGSLANRVTKLWVVDINSTGNIETSQNVSAKYFKGDGSLLTNLTAKEETDPAWAANFTNMQTDCPSNNYAYGINGNGTLKCRQDQAGSELIPVYLGNNLTATNANYTTVFTIALTPSQMNIVQVYLAQGSSTNGVAIQNRAIISASGPTGICNFVTQTQAGAEAVDNIAVGTDSADTGKTAMSVGTNVPFINTVTCTVLADANQINLIIQFDSETVATVTTYAGSYYTNAVN